MELLKELKERNVEAQERLHKTLFPKILATCRHCLTHHMFIEDIAEDIWMDFVYKYVDSVHDEKAMASYVRMMTIRRCIRERKKADRLEPLAEEHLLIDETPSDRFVQDIDTRRELKNLELCMKYLDSPKKRMIRLRFFHGLKLEQIGERFEVTKQHINQTIKRILKQLAQCLEEKRA